MSHFQLLCNSQHQSVNHHCQSTHLLIISLSTTTVSLHIYSSSVCQTSLSVYTFTHHQSMSTTTVSLHFHSSSVYVNHHCQSTLSLIISLSTTTVSLNFHSSSVCQPPLSVYTFTHHQSVNHHCQSTLSLIISLSTTTVSLHFHSSSVCQPPLSVSTFTHHQMVKSRHGPVWWRPTESLGDRLRHCGRLRTSPYSLD